MATSAPTIAARYVQALIARFTEASAQDGLMRELADWATAANPKAPLGQMAANPSLPRMAAEGVVKGLAEHHKASAAMQSLLVLLARQRRLNLLPDIATLYISRIRASRGIAQADVFSAVKLSETQKADIQKVLGKAEIRWHEDASLLGGLVLEQDGKRLDLSVAGQLKNAAQALGVSYQSSSTQAPSSTARAA